MTKTEITTALNSFISAIGKITKSRHTSANALLVDELYPPVLFEKSNGTKVITSSSNGIEYDLFFTKQGKIVNVSGTLRNTTGSPIVELRIAFSFLDAEFIPFSILSPQNRQKFIVGSVNFEWSEASGGQLLLPNGVVQTTSIQINTTYTTQN